MNSYKIIEGHATHPLDIEKALKAVYSLDSAKRALQLESKEHIEVQRLIEENLSKDPNVDICSRRFHSLDSPGVLSKASPAVFILPNSKMVAKSR